MPAGPRILLLDIETAPNLAYVWGLWDQNVGLNQIEAPTEILCFAAKWLGERKTFFYPRGGDMLQEAWALLDEADAVMHYNGQRFDIPHLNREFVQGGLGPPSPYEQIDLYKIVKFRFKFPSNKLAYVAPALGLKGKVEHEGFDLWRKVMLDDPAAWKRMERYNRRDVVLLEELYEVLLPWITNLPHRGLYDGHTGCPACGADASCMVRRGIYRTKVSVFQRFTCTECGSWFRATKRDSGVQKQPAR